MIAQNQVNAMNNDPNKPLTAEVRHETSPEVINGSLAANQAAQEQNAVSERRNAEIDKYNTSKQKVGDSMDLDAQQAFDKRTQNSRGEMLANKGYTKQAPVQVPQVNTEMPKQQFTPPSSNERMDAALDKKQFGK